MIALDAEAGADAVSAGICLPACLACRPVDTLARFDDPISQELAVKVLSSLKSAKQRHRDCKIVRRRGKVFVICKSNPRFKARQR